MRKLRTNHIQRVFSDPVTYAASKLIKYLHLVQYNTHLWTNDQIKKFFTLRGRIFNIKHLNKFFKKLYFACQKKALYYQEKKQGMLKFKFQAAADSVGYNHLCLTSAQVNTRRDITIMFESAYVPNVKLLMTDDHRFLDLVAEEGDVRELFWATALEAFCIDLTLKVYPAENLF